MHLLLFLLFPALELYLIVLVGGVIGPLNMVIWVFASAILGIWAAKRQGRQAMIKMQAELNEGRVPKHAFVDGVLLFLAGVMLILPGLITDAAGLLLLVPPIRSLAALLVVRHLEKRQARGETGSVFLFRSVRYGGFKPQAPDADVFDGESQLPRQATVLESRTIETSAAEGDKGPQQRNDPHDGPDRS